MKLSYLKQLVQQYEQHKGLRRRLFGDPLQITVLKELITEMTLKLDNDAEISLKEYQDFAIKKGYSIDLSDNYLASNSASSRIFVQWKQEQENNEATLQALSQSLAQINITDIISNQINLPPLDLPPLNLTISSLSTRLINDITRLNRQIEPQLFYSQFNRHILFQHSTPMTNAAPYSYAENNDDDDDFDYDGPRCAPAA